MAFYQCLEFVTGMAREDTRDNKGFPFEGIGKGCLCGFTEGKLQPIALQALENLLIPIIGKEFYNTLGDAVAYLIYLD